MQDEMIQESQHTKRVPWLLLISTFILGVALTIGLLWLYMNQSSAPSNTTINSDTSVPAAPAELAAVEALPKPNTEAVSTTTPTTTEPTIDDQPNEIAMSTGPEVSSLEPETAIAETDRPVEEVASTELPMVEGVWSGDMNSVPDGTTHIAARSGAWSDAATWQNQIIPTSWANVYVPSGVTVIVDQELSTPHKTVDIDGTLQFATDRDTTLLVETIFTGHRGHLLIGTQSNPVRADVTATVVFADDGPVSRAHDPELIRRGAILHGKTTMYGGEKLAFTSVASFPRAGNTSVTLSETPTGWRTGDEIVIAGVEADNPESDQVVTITSISGTTVNFTPALIRNHIPPRNDLDVHVANLTRNITFRSENDSLLHRGHVMFMHTNDADVRYVAFEDLGRTDKTRPVDDWEIVSPDGDFFVQAASEWTGYRDLYGTNVRGRYSVHFHRGGDDTGPAIVQGTVVNNDPGWAYVNHSANVDFLDNVSYEVVGAAYNTESGDEIGSFKRNIAIRNVNPFATLNPADGETADENSPDVRVLQQDFGFQGCGFWFHGAGVAVEDNVVSGATGHAYIYWKLGLVEKGLGENLADAGNVPNGYLIGPPGTKIPTLQVPVTSFDNNVAYSATKGLYIAYLHTDNRDEYYHYQAEEGNVARVPQAYEDQLQSTFSNFTAWNIPSSGIAAPYSTRLTFRNIDLIGDGKYGSIGIKLDQFSNRNDLTIENASIDGFTVGIAAPRQGQALINGAQIFAPNDIRIIVPDRAARDLTIRDVTFLDNSVVYGSLGERINIEMAAAFDLGLAGGILGIDDAFFDEPHLLNVPPIFHRDRIVLDIPGYRNQGLYFYPQAADFVPVPEGGELSEFVRSELVGLTNAELQADFGISFSDAVAPTSAYEAPQIEGGVVGPAIPSAGYRLEPDTYWRNYLASLGEIF
ncbi:MAG: G8 domain-containing protein [Patescibacteria group bacterium]